MRCGEFITHHNSNATIPETPGFSHPNTLAHEEGNVIPMPDASSLNVMFTVCGLARVQGLLMRSCSFELFKMTSANVEIYHMWQGRNDLLRLIPSCFIHSPLPWFGKHVKQVQAETVMSSSLSWQQLSRLHNKPIQLSDYTNILNWCVHPRDDGWQSSPCLRFTKI